MDTVSATAVATIVQAVFTGLLAVLTYFYVRTTGRQLAAMRGALEQTRRSNEATEKSNEIAERTLELGSRAWLVVSIRIVLGERHGNFTGYSVDLSNVGRVPATDVVVWYRFDEWDSAIPETIPLRAGQVSRQGIIIGGGETHSIVPPREEWESFGKDDLSKTLKTFYCEVTYRDIFQKPRKTVACWQYLPKTTVFAHQSWIYAPKHNRLE